MKRRWTFELVGKPIPVADDVALYVGQALDDEDMADQVVAVGDAIARALPDFGGPARYSEISLVIRCDTSPEQWSSLIQKWLKPGQVVSVGGMSEQELMRRATCPECGDHYPTHKQGCGVAKKHGLQ